ncbi:hypothetical protein DL93DRAFT_846246 [Clavulina sp. PMI_390]|nr:hypothetical protein DL93DRAFT_846246 [Clavulina sp. PMI_390]
MSVLVEATTPPPAMSPAADGISSKPVVNSFPTIRLDESDPKILKHSSNYSNGNVESKTSTPKSFHPLRISNFSDPPSIDGFTATTAFPSPTLRYVPTGRGTPIPSPLAPRSIDALTSWPWNITGSPTVVLTPSREVLSPWSSVDVDSSASTSGFVSYFPSQTPPVTSPHELRHVKSSAFPWAGKVSDMEEGNSDPPSQGLHDRENREDTSLAGLAIADDSIAGGGSVDSARLAALSISSRRGRVQNADGNQDLIPLLSRRTAIGLQNSTSILMTLPPTPLDATSIHTQKVDNEMDRSIPSTPAEDATRPAFRTSRTWPASVPNLETARSMRGAVSVLGELDQVPFIPVDAHDQSSHAGSWDGSLIASSASEDEQHDCGDDDAPRPVSRGSSRAISGNIGDANFKTPAAAPGQAIVEEYIDTGALPPVLPFDRYPRTKPKRISGPSSDLHTHRKSKPSASESTTSINTITAADPKSTPSPSSPVMKSNRPRNGSTAVQPASVSSPRRRREKPPTFITSPLYAVNGPLYCPPPPHRGIKPPSSARKSTSAADSEPNKRGPQPSGMVVASSAVLEPLRTGRKSDSALSSRVYDSVIVSQRLVLQPASSVELIEGSAHVDTTGSKYADEENEVSPEPSPSLPLDMVASSLGSFSWGEQTTFKALHQFGKRDRASKTTLTQSHSQGVGSPGPSTTMTSPQPIMEDEEQGSTVGETGYFDDAFKPQGSVMLRQASIHTTATWPVSSPSWKHRRATSAVAGWTPGWSPPLSTATNRFPHDNQESDLGSPGPVADEEIRTSRSKSARSSPISTPGLAAQSTTATHSISASSFVIPPPLVARSESGFPSRGNVRSSGHSKSKSKSKFGGVGIPRTVEKQSAKLAAQIGERRAQKQMQQQQEEHEQGQIKGTELWKSPPLLPAAEIREGSEMAAIAKHEPSLSLTPIPAASPD